jgi:hypothetical protein
LFSPRILRGGKREADEDPAPVGDWYGELGHFLTPKFFGMKINKYMQVPGGPKVGYTQLYGAPGVAGVSILSV